MASTKKTARAANPTSDVDAFLASLEHPYKSEVLALRQLILSVDDRISEGIKWNAPSFRTSEWFATFQLRAKDGVQVILHLGAKKGRELAPADFADPSSLLEWLGPDRASVKFRDMAQIERARPALVAILRQWLERVE